MRSLFLKIFLSFWLAQALFLVLATLVTLAIRQQAESAWEAEQAQILSQAVQAYETGGQASLVQYLDQVRQSQGVRAYLLDENDQELSGRRLPDWVKDGERRRPRPPRGSFLGWMAARPQRQSITSASGHRYTLVMFPPPHGPFGDRNTWTGNLHRNSFFRPGVLPACQILNLSGGPPPGRNPKVGCGRFDGPRGRASTWPAR